MKKIFKENWKVLLISLLLSGVIIFVMSFWFQIKISSPASNFDITSSSNSNTSAYDLYGLGPACDDCPTYKDYGFPLIFKTTSSGGWNWGVIEFNILYFFIDSLLVLIVSFIIVFTINYIAQIIKRKYAKSKKTK